MPEDTLLQEIQKSKSNVDKLVSEAIDRKDKDWIFDDNIFYWQNCIYIPRDQKLRGRIIQAHHDTVLSGHPGQYKTWELVARNYWWPGLNRDVAKYVKGCEKCQATKAHRTRPTGLLNPHDVPTEPWEMVGTDLIGELPSAHGYNAIAVVIDHMTKHLHLFPTHMTLTSEGMARIYRDKIFPVHGMPRKIIHN